VKGWGTEIVVSAIARSPAKISRGAASSGRSDRSTSLAVWIMSVIRSVSRRVCPQQFEDSVSRSETQDLFGGVDRIDPIDPGGQGPPAMLERGQTGATGDQDAHCAEIA